MEFRGIEEETPPFKDGAAEFHPYFFAVSAFFKEITLRSTETLFSKARATALSTLRMYEFSFSWAKIKHAVPRKKITVNQDFIFIVII